MPIMSSTERGLEAAGASSSQATLALTRAT